MAKLALVLIVAAVYAGLVYRLFSKITVGI